MNDKPRINAILGRCSEGITKIKEDSMDLVMIDVSFYLKEFKGVAEDWWDEDFVKESQIFYLGNKALKEGGRLILYTPDRTLYDFRGDTSNRKIENVVIWKYANYFGKYVNGDESKRLILEFKTISDRYLRQIECEEEKGWYL